MDITALYKSILQSLNVVSDDSGLLSLSLHKVSPVTIGDKRLALPTRDILNNADFSKVMVFHPLSEDITKSESAVLQRVRKLVSLRIITSLQLLATELLAIAASPDLHGTLTPTQHKTLLKPLSRADGSTLSQLSDIMGKLSLTGNQKLVNLYLKRGGKLDGVGYTRSAIVSFPMLNELENTDRKVYGTTLKVENQKTIKALFELILPKYSIPETYSFGSNSKVAPYFHAMVGAYGKIATRLNAVAEEYKAVLTCYKDVVIEIDWLDYVADLTPFNNKLEPMEGNMGSNVSATAVETLSKSKNFDVADIASGNEVVNEGRVGVAAVSAPAAYTPPAATLPATGNAPAPVQSTANNNKLDFAALAQQRFQAAQQQQMQQQQAMQLQYAQQQQQMRAMQPWQPQQPMYPVAQPAYPFQPAGHLQPPGGLVPQQPQPGYGFNNGSANHVRGNPQMQPAYGTYNAPAPMPYNSLQYPQQPQQVMYPSTII